MSHAASLRLRTSPHYSLPPSVPRGACFRGSPACPQVPASLWRWEGRCPVSWCPGSPSSSAAVRLVCSVAVPPALPLDPPCGRPPPQLGPCSSSRALPRCPAAPVTGGETHTPAPRKAPSSGPSPRPLCLERLTASLLGWQKHRCPVGSQER